MTTTNKKVGAAKQGRGAQGPIWHRLRDALADIGRGLYPQRAFDYHRLPKAWLTDARMQPRIARAEATAMYQWLDTVNAAGADRLHYEYQWQTVDAATLPPLDDLPLPVLGNRPDTRGRPLNAAAGPRALPTRARAWTKEADWKAHMTLLERRFPREYGAVATPDVGSQVVEVIKAMAALRASVAGQPPQGLPTSLIARPQLPTRVDEDAHASAHAREGDGETGETGTPR